MLEIIAPSEHILCSSYKDVCDGLPNVVYHNTEDVFNFFAECEKGKHPPCVVVSAHCDFSIREQQTFHPNNDLMKLASTVAWADLAHDRDSYHTVTVSAQVQGKCHPRDRFAARTDRYTFWTMPDLPANVLRWYVTNLDVRHDRMMWLPFGLNNDGDGFVRLRSHMNKEKRKLLYVNFSENTHERVDLLKWCKAQPWITVRAPGLPVEQFLEEMAEHKYVLCPFGNGMDCYRTYEAMYLGSIPILPHSTFTEHVLEAGLPAICVDNLKALSADFLEKIYPDVIGTQYRYDKLSKTFWNKEFACATHTN